MKSIRIKLEFEGKKYDLHAVTDDNVRNLTKHKCNEKCNLTFDCGMWFLYFYCEGQYDFEVRGEYDEDFNKYISYIAPWDKEDENWSSDIYVDEIETNF